MLYVAVTANGGWVALLVFAAASKNLKARESWIGWTPAQKRKRLALMANNARFLVLPKYRVPNMGSRILRLTTDRISDDWQKQYAHPLVALETFVDIEQFRGTVYTAASWVERGKTSGYGRCRKDYYVKHNKPKALFVKELYRNAKRSLQAEHLKPALAVVEEKVALICDKSTKQLRSLKEYFMGITDPRSRIELYPIWTILAIVACAHFAGAPRGPTDLAAFAKRLTLHQRKALGIRRDKYGKYSTPSAASFCRILQEVDALKVGRAIVMEHGGDYIFTVKKNQSGLQKTLARSLADIPASFSPSEGKSDTCLDRRDQQE